MTHAECKQLLPDFYREKIAQHGAKFDPSELDKRFAEYYRPHRSDRARIRVQCDTDDAMTGTVGVTTGWRPIFLLMRTARSIGSCWTLGPHYRITGIKGSRGYIPISQPATRAAESRT